MQRLFTSGSRQAPDPFDQFLEQNNFYRKHTARDSSCLFRVISEQMYDTQQHHLEIRKKCVFYMRKNRNLFAPLVDRDFDEYLDDLSKPKAYGSLVELQALAYMFQRNVLLFEPFNLGNLFCTRSHFVKVFRVFYSPERHFDSVFTCDYIKDAAICQSICYEILYKDLFKLPDVNYAVEKMLHADSAEGRMEYNPHGYAVRVYLTDGRIFDLDLPQKTDCILENYKLCHYHYANFPRFTDDLQRELRVLDNQVDRNENKLSNCTAESYLPDKYVSCVRQLLREGITPFPYKVAKALDPNMYRNIEFDAWNEARKELRMQNWYNGDNNFKVGAKCHVRLRKSENDLYTCHIQEISVDKGYCVVFIEQLGEKRMVPYESLSPLPPEQFKPWSPPYRLRRHSVRFTRHYNYHLKLNGQFSATHEFCAPMHAIKAENWDNYTDGAKHHQYYSHATYNAAPLPLKDNCFYKLKQFTQLDNFHPPTIEYCTMPLTVETRAAESKSSDANLAQNCETGSQISECNAKSQTEAQNKTDNGGNVVNNTTTEDTLTNSMEHLVIDPNGGFGMGATTYMPDVGYCYYQSYPTNYYTNGVDDYYGGQNYDYPVTYSGGTVYYMCPQQTANGSFPFSPSGNMYIPAPMAAGQHQTLNPANAMHMQTQPAYFNAPNTAGPVPIHSLGSSTIACSTAACYSSGSITGTPAMLPPTTAIAPKHYAPAYNSPNSTRGRGGMPHPSSQSRSPSNGRINWEAKKSTKANGVDLPTDMATLRYFYNLGLEFHHQKLNQRKEEQNAENNKDHAKLNENANQHDGNKSDPNNNNGPNLNSQQLGGNSNYTGNNYKNPFARRYNSRYYSVKDRPGGNSRYVGNNASNSNVPVVGAACNHPMSTRNQQNNNDYNNNAPKHNYANKSCGNFNGSGTTPNSSRHQALCTTMTGGSSSSGGRNGGGSNVSGSHSHNAEHMSSPLNNFDGGAGGDPQQQNQPNVYNQSSQHQYMHIPYEHIGDNLQQQPTTPSGLPPPPPPLQGSGNGMFIPMGPPPPFGVFTNAPPPNMPGGSGYSQQAPTFAGIPPQFTQMPPPTMGLLPQPPPGVPQQIQVAGTANGLQPMPQSLINNNNAGGANNGLFSTPTSSESSENCASSIGVGEHIGPNGGASGGAAQYYHYPPPPPQHNAPMPYFYAHGNAPMPLPNVNPPSQYYWNAQQPAATHANTSTNSQPTPQNNSANDYNNASNRNAAQQTDNPTSTTGQNTNTATNNTAGKRNQPNKANNK